MNLLIDMGNSRLKWAFAKHLEIQGIQAIANINVNVVSLSQAWKHLNTPEKITISQVSSTQFVKIVNSVIKQLWPDARLIFPYSQAFAYGVTNAYRQPEKLGVDRWLGIIAAYQRYSKGFCLVDCGTAITLDVVDASGKHLGGLISPGLQLMNTALATGTANLRLATTTFSIGLADHTAAAIHNGTLAAACGFIEHTLTHEARDYPLVITGGDAELIAHQLGKPAAIEPDLVFYGLAMISSSI